MNAHDQVLIASVMRHAEERRRRFRERPLTEAEADEFGEIVSDLCRDADHVLYRQRDVDDACDDILDVYTGDWNLLKELLVAVIEEQPKRARAALDKVIGLVAKYRVERRS